MSIVLREGIPEDVPAVLELVKQLAEFEKAPNEVAVSLDEMQRWGFGSEKVYDFFVLLKNDHIVGTAIYYYKYSTWKGRCLFLEDIIVTEHERGQGFGKLLFNAVADVAKREKVRRMEWQVLNWNRDAIRFYETYEAHFDEEWINCKLVYDQLQSM